MKSRSISIVTTLFLSTLAVATAGCGSSLEPTIAQGVYGQTVSYEKTTDPPGSAVPNVHLGIYDLDPAATSATAVEPKKSVSSDEDGFYELTLEVGDAWICVLNQEGLVQDQCKKFHVSQNVTTRVDHAFGLEHPWSNTGGGYVMSSAECQAAGGAVYADNGGGSASGCDGKEVIGNVSSAMTIEGAYCCR